MNGKALLISTLGLLAAPAFAGSPAEADAGAAQDEFEPVRQQIQTCFACHGERGAAPLPTNPILAGQEYYYLYVQMRDFKSGLRKNEIMGPLMQPLELEQMKLIAKYFSQQTWPAIGHAANPEQIPLAKGAIESGECIACHLGDWKGNSRVPRVAGQKPDYLEKTLLDFKSRSRNNAPDKGALLATFSVEDLEALADYLGSLRVYQASKTAETQ